MNTADPFSKVYWSPEKTNVTFSVNLISEHDAPRTTKFKIACSYNYNYSTDIRRCAQLQNKNNHQPNPLILASYNQTFNITTNRLYIRHPAPIMHYGPDVMPWMISCKLSPGMLFSMLRMQQLQEVTIQAHTTSCRAKCVCLCETMDRTALRMLKHFNRHRFS